MAHVELVPNLLQIRHGREMVDGITLVMFPQNSRKGLWLWASPGSVQCYNHSNKLMLTMKHFVAVL